jgi:conjugal transfer mating pair stabilization protein TraN
MSFNRLSVLVPAALSLLVAVSAGATPINFTNYVIDGGGGWTNSAGNTVATATGNSIPSVYFDPASSVLGKTVTATFRVNERGDDDFFGLVLGYADNALTGGSPDYYLLDWKQGNQSGAAKGLRLSHVTAPYSGGNVVNSNFWRHNNGVDIVASGTTLGTTGWADLTDYVLGVSYTRSQISVTVNGQAEISYSGSFMDGNFGFYGFSQPNIVISDGRIDSVSAVPLPAAGLLLIGGLGGLAALRRWRAGP